MDVKPDAFAAFQHYDSERYWTKIRPLIQPLGSEFPEWTIDERKLGQFVKNLNVFMEQVSGKESLDRPFLKFPAKLFRDFNVSGSLHTIFQIYAQFLQKHNLQELNLLISEEKEHNVEFLNELREALEQRQRLQKLVIHVDSSNGEEKSKLEDIIKSLGGIVASSPNDELLTHTVYSFGPGGDPDDGVQYLRSLEARPGEFFVHYWYYPDSYDNWMTAEMAPENLEPDHKVIGPWKIYTRWLLDSQRFNEWMNPIDYETEEFQEEQEALRFQAEEDEEDLEDDLPQGTGSNSEEDMESMTTEDTAQIKRKRESLGDFSFARTHGSKMMLSEDGVQGPQHKKQMTNDQIEVDQSAAEKIAPNVTKHKALDLTKVPFDGPIKTISEALESVQAPGNDIEECKRQLYTVPLHASWFDWDSIHEIEKEAISFLNDDGDGDDNESSYMESEDYTSARNSIINMFRAKPNKKLKFLDVRRDLVGDESQLKAIFEFLDSWGLINFFTASSGNGKSLFDSSEWESAVSLPNQAPPLVTVSNMISSSDAEAAITGGGELSYGLLSKPNKYGKTVMESGQEQGRIRCNAMPWVDCTDSHYHCTTHPDVDLCPQAFTEGRFPAGTSGKDFVKITGAGMKPDANGWTEQETLLLLEAIELYGEDWSEIAEHVSTKSQLQCAMQWLTMPIEDDIIHELLADNPTEEDDLSTTVPFADAQNPIMAQVAFLAAMVSPEVAGAAAQEGLHVLAQEDSLNPDPEGGEVRNSEGHIPNSIFTGSLQEQNHFYGVSEEAIRKASADALKSAAIKAKLLAEQQERDIKKLMATVIDAQLKKLDIKLSYCKDQDHYLDEERTNLQSTRQHVNAERMQLKSVLQHEITSSSTNIPTTATSSVAQIHHSVNSSSHENNSIQSDQGIDNGTTIIKTEDVQQNGH